MEEIQVRTAARRLRFRSVGQICIAGSAIAGGAIIILGTALPWFSLFARLQPYRGLDVLNGRLLAGGGAVSVLVGLWFLRSSGRRLRWGIGLFGFAMLAFSGWSLFQLLILYRELSSDPMMVAKLGSGLMIVMVGALIIFATLFFDDR